MFKFTFKNICNWLRHSNYLDVCLFYYSNYLNPKFHIYFSTNNYEFDEQFNQQMIYAVPNKNILEYSVQILIIDYDKHKAS